MLTQNDHYGEKSLSFVGLSEAVFGDDVEAALEYRRRGLMVTPLHGKRPVLKNWPQRELSEDELPDYFVDGRNLGIVLGDAAGLVDVDLDNPVAVTVADVLLPDTVKSGRKKNPRSHHWFVCDPAPPSRRYFLTKPMADRLMIESGEATLVELRSTGQQTMVPPSVHPVGGDRCVWYPGEIREMDGGELANLVLDVAVATLLALNRPLGSRTSFAIGAAGYLCPHFGAERAERIVEAASMAFDDEEHDERMWAVRSSLQKPIDGDPTIDADMAAELERLAPGVPGRISSWCARCDEGGAT
ncbi:MAG: bifunctional DNA primase/polymerase [Rubrobacteraceae bacterium]